ncbi:hypothetical protein V2W30_02645 [Streptomyces sp. Q6]|uniref:Uncharacterized protein n=1 Tax=Streptomyces citrinus TaxID=3118173 RepID=A0ACD5A5H1_9ACTN
MSRTPKSREAAMTTIRPGRRLRGNPLSRRSDVLEAWAALLLGVLGFLVAPVAGAASGWSAHADAVHQARVEAADRHFVRARLVEDAPAAVPAANGAELNQTYPVRVRWTDGGGRPVTARSSVQAGLDRGSAVTVWLDSRGAVTKAPMDTGDIWTHTFAAVFLVTVTTAALAGVALVVLRRVLRRGRLAAWEREWARVGPGWCRRPA